MSGYKGKLTDYIRREDAIKALCKSTCYRGVFCPDEYCVEVRGVFDDIPAAVDAVPVVHGRWKEDPGVGFFWVCSACGYPSEAFAANVLYKYCPRCGARMEEQNG